MTAKLEHFRSRPSPYHCIGCAGPPKRDDELEECIGIVTRGENQGSDQFPPTRGGTRFIREGQKLVKPLVERTGQREAGADPGALGKQHIAINLDACHVIEQK